MTPPFVKKINSSCVFSKANYSRFEEQSFYQVVSWEDLTNLFSLVGNFKMVLLQAINKI